MKCGPDMAKQILGKSDIADGLIKLHPWDYCAIPKCDRIMHVNAMPCTHEAKRKYAIVPIVGRDETGEPLLNIADPLIVFCEKTMVLPTLKMLGNESLPRIIGLPSSIQELGDMMFSRYGLTRNWTSESVMSKPVMLSNFRRVTRLQVETV